MTSSVRTVPTPPSNNYNHHSLNYPSHRMISSVRTVETESIIPFAVEFPVTDGSRPPPPPPLSTNSPSRSVRSIGSNKSQTSEKSNNSLRQLERSSSHDAFHTKWPYPCSSSSLPSYLAHVPHDIQNHGYAILSNLLSKEECEDAMCRLWDFVCDVSGGMVEKDDVKSWYGKEQLKVIVSNDKRFFFEKTKNDSDEENNANNPTDPWPYTNDNTPDLFQSLGAGYLLGNIREILADRVYRHILGTHELHCSKEGFTFGRPSIVELEGKEYMWKRKSKEINDSPRLQSVCSFHQQDTSKVPPFTLKCCISFLNQKKHDGHLSIYLHTNIHPTHIYLNQGDAIIYKSSNMYSIIPSTEQATSFVAMGYFSMCLASQTPSYIKKKKLEAYKLSRTGEHTSYDDGEGNWYLHDRWGGVSIDSRIRKDAWYEHSNNSTNINWILARQRSYYRLGPPIISIRLAQLYTLLPYGLVQLDEVDYISVIQSAVRRGVRLTCDMIDTQPNVIQELFYEDTTCPEKIITPAPLCSTTIKTLALKNQCPIQGQDKYLGGIYSPCGTYVYGVPGKAKRVLRIHTETDEIDFIGPVYDGDFKWLRGVEVPASVMDNMRVYPSGCCIALPCNSPCVLKINPYTNNVTTFGNVTNYIDKAPDIRNSHVTNNITSTPSKWFYHGGNLVSDGYIYTIPANATYVLKIDPRNDLIEPIGPCFLGPQKWYGGVVGYDGNIYGIPQNATGVLKIEPIKQAVSILGNNKFSSGGWKWHGGMAIQNGELIIGFPNNANKILIIDVKEQCVFTVGDESILKSGRHRIPNDQKYKYLGGVMSADGMYSYLFPCEAEQVLRMNNHTLELALVGPKLLDGFNKYQNGFLGSDKCLYAIPQNASGVLRIIPGSVRKNILSNKRNKCENNTEDYIDILYCGEDMDQYKDKFEGGVLSPNGNIYCMPLRAKAVLKVIPSQGFKNIVDMLR